MTQTDTDPVLAKVPRPRVAGSEMENLARFLLMNIAWDGEIVAGGMGPESPRMTATGGGTAHTIQEGRWIAGDYWQDQRLEDGSFVLRWELHFVAGWNLDAGAYRATYADVYGHAGVMHGRIEGDVLTFESPPGEEPHLRMTWRTEGEVVAWRNEVSVAGGPYSLIEEYRCRRI